MSFRARKSPSNELRFIKREFDSSDERVSVNETNVHTVPVNVTDPAAAAAAYEQMPGQHFPADKYPRGIYGFLSASESEVLRMSRPKDLD